MDINMKQKHDNSKCSICNISPIIGIRYVCLECVKFQLCQECEKKIGEKHGHQMLMLRRSKDLELYKNCINKLKDLNLNEPIEDCEQDQEQESIDISKCSYICTNLQKVYITKNNNNFIPISVCLKNTGTSRFPSPCYFVCDSSSQIFGNRIKLNQTNTPEIKFNIKILLDKIKKSGTYKSIWQLRNEKNESFGEKITFMVKVIFEKKLCLKETYKKKDYRDNLEQSINELKSQPLIYQKFSESSIKNALIRAKGNKENAMKMLITQDRNKAKTII